MSHTRVKICGITRVQDALCAAEHGADAIGLVFYARSPRHLSIEQAAAICAELPAFVTTVALFNEFIERPVSRETGAVSLSDAQTTSHRTESLPDNSITGLQ